ncbi:MAG TPA: TIGR03667 family PPOX class F420-dependent oxidoreductase [Thermomicrobiales bacterium]|nr:TIGR03667 family PPOX class F420-dependent oxidoreductase [Thermomicrobiales bacterium]
MFTIDTSTDFGARVARRLQEETVIWLTTVGHDGTPEPSPVWFLWTGSDVLIFSQRNKPKLRNIARSSAVSLNFDSTNGGNVVIFTGTARLNDAAPSAEERDAYNQKYDDDIRRIGFDLDSFHQEYSVPLRVTPEKLRGF